jgi:hypothetical protein
MFVERKIPKPGPLQLGPGSLYSAFPIPAFQSLASAGEHSANRVLSALVSHLGKDSNLIFPSIETLTKETGMNRSSVVKALNVLYDFGFIHKFKTKAGKHLRNNYIILPAAYNRSRFSGLAAQREIPIGVCQACGNLTKRSSVGIWGVGEGYAHFGCGGRILEFKGR